MALIKCKECGQMISDKAKECPKCGCPIEETENEVVNEEQESQSIENTADSDVVCQKKTNCIPLIIGIAILLIIIVGLIIIAIQTGSDFRKEYQTHKEYYDSIEVARQEAEQRDADAQHYEDEGNRYHKKNDHAEAVKWWRKAAELGRVYAQNDLGVAYQRGEGVKQDHAEAVKWYRKAAEQGHTTAQNNLGYCYDKGEGVEQDYTEAVKWYRKAAEQGHAGAQCNLGTCYHYGRGVKQDHAEAIKWWRKAAKQGDETAKNNLKAIGVD